MEEFLVLFAGCTGLLVTTVLFFPNRKNRMVNGYLLTILIYVSLYCLVRSTYALGIQSWVDQNFFGFKRLSIFNFPLFYLFIKQVLTPSNERWGNWLHFIFPLIFYGLVQALEAMGELSPGIIFVFYLMFFGCSMVYLTLSIRLFKSYRPGVFLGRLLRGQGSRMENWLFFILAIWIFLSLRILVIAITNFVPIPSFGYENGFWLCALLLVFLFVKILVSPELMYGLGLPTSIPVENGGGHGSIALDIWKSEKPVHFNNQQDLLLSQKINESLVENFLKIERATFEDKLFRNPKFDLNMLSARTKLPKSHLTYLFKYHCTLYFPDFRRLLQIRDAEHLIRSGYLRDNTLESLSLKVGFSSYNPFFTAFKKHTGMPPQHYVDRNAIQSPLYPT